MRDKITKTMPFILRDTESIHPDTYLAIKNNARSICILSQTHLCRNPRVWKECYALDQAGHSVTVLTTFYDDRSYKEDLQLIKNTSVQYLCYVDLRNESKNYFNKLYFKLLRKFGNWLVRNKLLNTALALGYGYQVLYQKALLQDADLYICHQEMASYVGILLLRKEKKVAFDIEDWYSEDLLPKARRNRPIDLLKRVEEEALLKGINTWTTSFAMANALASTYRAPKPAVIYNSFPKISQVKEHIYKDRVDLNKVSLFWFSQTIGPGRGLEMLISALKCINMPFELHLRGIVREEYQQALSDQFNNLPHQTLHFHNLVPNEELPLRIAEHDIGLALENKEPLSRNYTITNKILQYLQAGLAVVASSTEGQIEVAEKKTGAVFLFDHQKSLSSQIYQLISDRKQLENAKREACKLFEQSFLWEKEAEKLCKLVELALTK